MIEYIKVLRLPIVFMAGLCCFVSFKVSHVSYSVVLPVLFMLFMSSTCMVQNDWRDRDHDKRKKKYFASEKPFRFLAFLSVLWLATLILGIALYLQQPKFIFIILFSLVSGITYSETRKIAVVPNLLVALNAGATTLFPVFISDAPPLIIFMFFSVTAIIFAREIIKDVEDVECDVRYKKTLPILIGKKLSKSIAGIIIILASIISLIFSIKTLGGVLFLIASAIYLLSNADHRVAKNILNIGMLLALIALSV